MRYLPAATLLLALAAAPTTQAQAPSSATERTILRLEDDWARALVRRDSAAFHRLLAPAFVYTENERVMTKAELIREVVSGSDTVTAARNEGLRVQVYGTAAVVTGVLALDGRGASGAFNRRFRFTDTWVRRNGRWQVVAAQDYLLPR